VGWAHPHGSIECQARVQMHRGVLAQLRGTLVLDEAHSREALATLETTPGLGPDPDLLRRFAFGLTRQFGRLNWLFSLEADGRPVPLQAAEPDLAFEGGRLRIGVVFEAAADTPPGREWKLGCADPAYYWVTSFGQPLHLEVSTDGGTAGAVRIEGCQAAPLTIPAVERRQGVARHDWRCD
jgi:ABC-type uncharacterized transport system substrate-binding protein